MISIWSKTSNLKSFENLNNDIDVDVLIIGAGMAGILSAYMLEQYGINYAVVEADKICSGITKNTTAKITMQHGLVYHKIIDTFGIKKAKMYLEANKIALEKYENLCKDIDCDYVKKDSFVYSLNDKQIIEKEYNALKKLNYDAEIVNKTSLPFKISGAVKFKNQAQFHPLKFVSHISQGLKIYENTRVKQIKDNIAITDNGNIRANKIIIATHFPFVNSHGSYFLKMYQERSYVIALKDAENIDGMYVDEAKTGLSFRNYKDLLLIGGPSYRTGKKNKNWQELDDFAEKYYPNAKKVAQWATQDCITLDNICYIGQYSKNTPNYYVATGFNKWGMSSSMVAANILVDIIRGVQNQISEVFCPSRSILHPQLFINSLESMTNLIKPTGKRCSHLGCALKWNAYEHSWDCPCHGSRFTKNGKIINNPANKNLKE